jgi:hypothetical protein
MRRALPVLDKLVTDLQAASIECGGKSLSQKHLTLIRSAIGQDFLREVVDYHLARVADGTEFLPVWSEAIMPLFVCSLFTLEVKLIRPGQHKGGTMIMGLVDDRILVPLSVPISATIYKQKEPYPNTELNTDKRLVEPSCIYLEVWESLMVAAGSDVVLLHDVSETSFLFVMRSTPSIRYHWIYDRSTLKPKALMDSNMTSGRITFALKLLKFTATDDAISTCSSLMSHPDHQVRWEAVRQALMIDHTQGRVLLASACYDPHPEVREAALLTTEELEGRMF